MKNYMMKFKNGIEDGKKSSILNNYAVLDFLSNFDIYVVSLNEEMMFSLRKNNDILYLKLA